jgi:hypothetical protein
MLRQQLEPWSLSALGFFFVASVRQSEDRSAACLFCDTCFRASGFSRNRAKPIRTVDPTARQNSDVRTPHNVMPTSNTAQSKRVNPTSLPSLIKCVIITAARRLIPGD